jgi:hypothetical protein
MLGLLAKTLSAEQRTVKTCWNFSLIHWVPNAVDRGFEHWSCMVSVLAPTVVGRGF